jgi:Putative zinc-finger
MSDDPKAAKTLRNLLDGTREQELDCDRFLELLPPYLDGRISDAELREQIAHHERLCPECHEELEILRRALEPDAT